MDGRGRLAVGLRNLPPSPPYLPSLGVPRGFAEGLRVETAVCSLEGRAASTRGRTKVERSILPTIEAPRVRDIAIVAAGPAVRV